MKQAEFCTDPQSLMRAHSRAIVHLRSQNQPDRKRMGLIIGAGVSKGIENQQSHASLPDWPTLIQRIATDPEIRGEKLLLNLGVIKKNDRSFGFHGAKKPLSSLAQIIFQHFKSNYIQRKKLNTPLSLIQERK